MGFEFHVNWMLFGELLRHQRLAPHFLIKHVSSMTGNCR